MVKKNSVILVLCHTRTWHLAKVIESLESCENIEDFEVIFVAQDSPTETLEIIDKFTYQRKLLIRIDGFNHPSTASAINRNLYIGLKCAFGQRDADFVCVIEDDIELSNDALRFFLECERVLGLRRSYRGAVGYSINVHPSQSKNDFILLNFGVGWGWTINKKNYEKIIKFWKGDEDCHWDYYIEPYIRTGYIAAPIYSKIRNIGFDSTASHTSNSSWLEQLIDKSFKMGKKKEHGYLREVSVPFAHTRSDAIVLSGMNLVSRFSLLLLRILAFVLYRLGIKPRPRIHFIWRLLRNWTDEKFSNTQISL